MRSKKLVPRLTDGDPDQVDDGTQELAGREVVVVMDFAADFHHPNRLSDSLINRGVSTVSFFALVLTDDRLPTAASTTGLLSLPLNIIAGIRHL